MYGYIVSFYGYDASINGYIASMKGRKSSLHLLNAFLSYNSYLQMPAVESFQYNYICSYDTRTDQEYEGQSNCPEEVSLTSRTAHIK